MSPSPRMLAVPRRVRPRLLAASLLAAAVPWIGGVEAVDADPSTPTDSTSAVRGAERPLPRRASAARHAARGALLVPWVALRVATWPLVKLAEVEDRSHAVSRLAGLLRFGYEREPFRSTLFFGYESSAGFSLVGLDATANDWPDPGARMRLSGGYLSDDENLAAFRFRSAPRVVQWEVMARYESRPDRKFHGVGTRSGERDFEAQRRRFLAEASLALRSREAWKVGLTGYLRRDELHSPEDDAEESVAVGFPALFTAARRSDYHGLEAELAWDTRDREILATRGVLVRALAGTDLADSRGDADYRHWLGEMQAHVELRARNRILALKALAEGVTSDDPEAVPYTELVRLGGKRGLRGYGSDRFTDRTGLLLTAEYRYPVTTRMSGSLFVDWGTVASRADELRLADIDPAVGMGLAYVVGDNGLLTHAARGSEGFEFYVGAETVFGSRSRRLR